MKISGMVKKSLLMLAGILMLNNLCSHAEDYDRFEIKYGMHERIVNEKYGEPLLVKKIKAHPIPRKKALYKTDDSNYMILYFFSGRIQKITLLQDVEQVVAIDLFSND